VFNPDSVRRCAEHALLTRLKGQACAAHVALIRGERSGLAEAGANLM